MSLYLKSVFYAVILCIMLTVSATAEEFGSCFVNEESSIDSVDEHFKVYHKNGLYLGYVFLLSDSSGHWSVWKEGEGEANEVFVTKAEAVFALCPPAT